MPSHVTHSESKSDGPSVDLLLRLIMSNVIFRCEMRRVDQIVCLLHRYGWRICVMLDRGRECNIGELIYALIAGLT
jgi:hypothetical protein